MYKFRRWKYYPSSLVRLVRFLVSLLFGWANHLDALMFEEDVSLWCILSLNVVLAHFKGCFDVDLRSLPQSREILVSVLVEAENAVPSGLRRRALLRVRGRRHILLGRDGVRDKGNIIFSRARFWISTQIADEHKFGHISARRPAGGECAN